MDNNNEDDCVIFKSWLALDQKQAYVPNVSGNKFHRMVRNYDSAPVTTSSRTPGVINHTDSLHIVKQNSIHLALTWPRTYNGSIWMACGHPVMKLLPRVYRESLVSERVCRSKLIVVNVHLICPRRMGTSKTETSRKYPVSARHTYHLLSDLPNSPVVPSVTRPQKKTRRCYWW